MLNCKEELKKKNGIIIFSYAKKYLFKNYVTLKNTDNRYRSNKWAFCINDLFIKSFNVSLTVIWVEKCNMKVDISKNPGK